MGVGVPYWTATDDDCGGGGVSFPDPVSVSDLPEPLVPFNEFLNSNGGGISGGVDVGAGVGGGSGGDEREGGREISTGVEIDYEPTTFDHPVFIMFSSGTTGLPKCMVHGAGGECARSAVSSAMCTLHL